MTPTRREFLKTTSAIAVGLAAARASASSPETEDGPGAASAPAPKRILILGGYRLHWAEHGPLRGGAGVTRSRSSLEGAVRSSFRLGSNVSSETAMTTIPLSRDGRGTSCSTTTPEIIVGCKRAPSY